MLSTVAIETIEKKFSVELEGKEELKEGYYNDPKIYIICSCAMCRNVNKYKESK